MHFCVEANVVSDSRGGWASTGFFANAQNDSEVFRMTGQLRHRGSRACWKK